MLTLFTCVKTCCFGSSISIGFAVLGFSHFHHIFLPIVGWVGHHLVGGLLASHGASKLRRRARDSTSDTEAHILAKMERKMMVSVAVLICFCCCCLYVHPTLATPAFLRQPSLVSSSANYVTQEVHWFSQRLDHFTSQVGQSVTHYSCIPFSSNSLTGFLTSSEISCYSNFYPSDLRVAFSKSVM